MKYELNVDRYAIDKVIEIYGMKTVEHLMYWKFRNGKKRDKNFIGKYSVWAYYTLFVKRLQNGDANIAFRCSKVSIWFHCMANFRKSVSNDSFQLWFECTVSHSVEL